MTYKRRCIALLEAGPATSEDVARAVYGAADAHTRARAARLINQVRSDGVPLRQVSRLDNGRRYGQALKLWELAR